MNEEELEALVDERVDRWFDEHPDEHMEIHDLLEEFDDDVYAAMAHVGWLEPKVVGNTLGYTPVPGDNPVWIEAMTRAQATVDSLVEKGYAEPFGVTSSGDFLYQLTDAGLAVYNLAKDVSDD